jgi:hypothetical protein
MCFHNSIIKINLKKNNNKALSEILVNKSKMSILTTIQFYIVLQWLVMKLKAVYILTKDKFDVYLQCRLSKFNLI